MSKFETIKKLPRVFKHSFALLKKHNPLILASSTAFFTMFSFGPIILILVNVLSLYFKSENVNEKLFGELQEIFGDQTAAQIHSIVENFKSLNSHWAITVGGSLFLIFVATTLLHVIKTAIHQLWFIQRKPAKRVRYSLKERSISFVLILSLGILLVVSLLLDAALNFLQGYLNDIVPSIDASLIWVIGTAFSITVVTAWFTILYKILPDAKVAWNIAIPGGLLTGILFNIGKFVLGKLLNYSNIETIFGTSASIALILLFIFYSSFIIYFGASFTYSYARCVDHPIKPGKSADSYEIKIIEN